MTKTTQRKIDDAADQFVATVLAALDVERFMSAAGVGTLARAIKSRMELSIREVCGQAAIEADVLHDAEAEMLADLGDRDPPPGVGV